MLSPALSFYESDTEPNGNYKNGNFPTEGKDVQVRGRTLVLWYNMTILYQLDFHNMPTLYQLGYPGQLWTIY